MAEVSEREGSVAAVEWRQKVVEENPNSVADAVALAKTAIKFGALDKAQAALERIGPKAESNPQYHEALGQVSHRTEKSQ